MCNINALVKGISLQLWSWALKKIHDKEYVCNDYILIFCHQICLSKHLFGTFMCIDFWDFIPPTYLFGVHFYSIVQRIPSNLSTLLKSKYKFRIIAKIELTTIIGKVFGFPLEHLILPFNLSTLQTSQSKNILIVQTRCRFLLF